MSVSQPNNVTETRNVTTTKNLNLQNIDGQVVTAGNEGPVTITYTDQGAIQAARDIAGESLRFSGEALTESLGFAKNVNQSAMSNNRAALDQVRDTSKAAMGYIDAANRDEAARNIDTLIKWGGGAAVAVVMVIAVSRSMN